MCPTSTKIQTIQISRNEHFTLTSVILLSILYGSRSSIGDTGIEDTGFCPADTGFDIEAEPTAIDEGYPIHVYQSISAPNIDQQAQIGFLSFIEQTGMGSSPASITFSDHPSPNGAWVSLIEGGNYAYDLLRYRIVQMSLNSIGAAIGTNHNNSVDVEFFGDVTVNIAHRTLYSDSKGVSWFGDIAGEIAESRLIHIYGGTRFSAAKDGKIYRMFPLAAGVFAIIELDGMPFAPPQICEPTPVQVCPIE